LEAQAIADENSKLSSELAEASATIVRQAKLNTELRAVIEADKAWRTDATEREGLLGLLDDGELLALCLFPLGFKGPPLAASVVSTLKPGSLRA